MDTRTTSHVVVGHLTIDAAGAGTLEEAFRQRLGEVDGVDGFQDLEVWRDTASPSGSAMVSWWDCETDVRTSMGSQAHRRSHARIPRHPHAPHATALDRYELIAR